MRYLYVAIVAVLVLVGLGFWFYHMHKENHPGKNSGVVFVINGKSYTKTTVNSIIAYPLKLQSNNRDVLTKKAYNYLKREQAAQQLNIVPTSQEISQAELMNFGPKLSNQLQSLSWVRLVSYDAALQQNLYTNNLSQYQGYSYIFWFGQALETGPAYTVPNFGNTQQVAQDRTYAKSRANYYYGQLKNGKMTASQVLKAVQDDPKLGYALPGNRSISQSTQFGSSSAKTWSEQVVYPDIIAYINSQSNSGLSSIRTGKIGVVPLPNPKLSKDYADGYFYIVQLTSAKKIPANTATNFTKTVNGIKAYYNGW